MPTESEVGRSVRSMLSVLQVAKLEAITGNFRALQGFWDEVRRTRRRWLDRRSQRARMNWPRFQALLQRHPLSPPSVVQNVYAQRSRIRGNLAGKRGISTAPGAVAWMVSQSATSASTGSGLPRNSQMRRSGLRGFS